jgi:predicted O-methyltransferase YrrM
MISAYTAVETDTYLHSKLVPPKDWANDPSLKRSKKRADDAGIPAIAVSPMQGQFLTILAKGMGASKILEIGTLWG